MSATQKLDCITERTDEHGYWWRYQHSNDEPRDTLTAAITIAGEVAANEARKSGKPRSWRQPRCLRRRSMCSPAIIPTPLNPASASGIN
jgi:hypothetical protein